MKKIVVIALFLIGMTSFGQNKNAKESFEVDGVCEMCEKRIETACIKIKGVKSANWNVQTHELKLVYNENKTNREAIIKGIVAVGHDTKELKATDKAYESLHPCCKYRDENIRDAHN